LRRSAYRDEGLDENRTRPGQRPVRQDLRMPVPPCSWRHQRGARAGRWSNPVCRGASRRR